MTVNNNQFGVLHLQYRYFNQKLFHQQIMLNSIDALFDGKVFHPEQPVTLKANTRVRIIVDNLSDENNELTSFLETAESLQLDGPSDWSENLDTYLYGEEKENES